MPQKFRFLCGNFNNRHYVYATKFERHPWYYFEELDCTISEHQSLPASLKNLIATIQELETIEVILNDDQAKQYFESGKFIFKNTELRTFKQLTKKVDSKKQLTFDSGESNPLLFLAEFQKCCDIVTDRDKTYKIRHFVDQQDKPEFSQLHFTSDWATVKTKFLQKYSLPFIENKKREMNFTFADEPSLRSFLNRKFAAFEKYTTLPLLNQMEIILNELPTNVAYLFMVDEKFDCEKGDILDYCDAIQELVEKHVDDKSTQVSVTEPLNRMEVFQYESDGVDDQDAEHAESMSFQADPSNDSVVRGPAVRGPAVRGRAVRGRGSKLNRSSTGSIRKYQPLKRKLTPMNSIPESDTEDAEYDFLDQLSNSSQSSHSSRSSGNSYMSLRSTTKKRGEN